MVRTLCLIASVVVLSGGEVAGATPAARGIQSPLDGLSAEDLATGKRLYDGMCARCHGMNGMGGEGPSLARPVLRHAPDDETLMALIQDGIPGTGMPQIRRLSRGELRQVAGYARSFGRTERASLPGNPERGRAIYEESTDCASCHIVAGYGGSLGPELTDVGLRRGPERLREALVSPGASLPPRLGPRDAAGTTGYAGFLVVRAVTRDGREVRGVRVNEDGFTIQVRDEGGVFHSLRKRDLQSLEKAFGESMMPSYTDQLSPSELDDLVAYLASLRGER